MADETPNRRQSSGGRNTVIMAEAFKPGAKPIRTATTIRCHQVSCSRGMIFVSTANNTTKAIRISHERTMDSDKRMFSVVVSG